MSRPVVLAAILPANSAPSTEHQPSRRRDNDDDAGRAPKTQRRRATSGRDCLQIDNRSTDRSMIGWLVGWLIKASQSLIATGHS